MTKENIGSVIVALALATGCFFNDHIGHDLLLVALAIVLFIVGFALIESGKNIPDDIRYETETSDRLYTAQDYYENKYGKTI